MEHSTRYLHLIAAPRGILAFYSEDELHAVLDECDADPTVGGRELAAAILRELQDTPMIGSDYW